MVLRLFSKLFRRETGSGEQDEHADMLPSLPVFSQETSSLKTNGRAAVEALKTLRTRHIEAYRAPPLYCYLGPDQRSCILAYLRSEGASFAVASMERGGRLLGMDILDVSAYGHLGVS